MSLSAPTLRRTLIVIPAARPRLAWALFLVSAGVTLIALSAQVRISIPPSPVPITGSTLGVLLIAAAYGTRLGTATVTAYAVAGIAGLPVFAGASSGWAVMQGATGGYIVGFIAAALLVGALAERGWDRRPWLTVAAMVAGNAVIYACGVLWLQHFVGWERVWALGVRPFLVGDAIKIAAAAGLLPVAWRLSDRR